MRVCVYYGYGYMMVTKDVRRKRAENGGIGLERKGKELKRKGGAKKVRGYLVDERLSGKEARER